MPDHLHLFLLATPQWAPNQLVGRLKGKSARLLRKEFPGLLRMPSLRTRSYLCCTVGTASSETIQRSIAEQTTRDWIVAKRRKVYRFRMKPTTAQGHALNRMAGARRFIWNLAFRRWKDHSAATAKSIPLAQLSSELTAPKKQTGNGLAERYGFASLKTFVEGPCANQAGEIF